VSHPRGVAVTPDGNHVYVTNAASDTVSVIDTATKKVVATVPVGENPFSVAVTSDGKHAYVTNVSVIDTASNTVAVTVPVGSHPVGVGIVPPGVPYGGDHGRAGE
jgi:YVTN family beta-propeller protein